MSMVIFHYLVHIKIKICLENIKLKTRMYVTIMYTSFYVRVITLVLVVLNKYLFCLILFWNDDA